MTAWFDAFLPLLPALVAWVPAGPLLVSAVLALGLLFGRLSGDAAERCTAAWMTVASGASLLLLLGIDLAAWHGGWPGRYAYGTWLAGEHWQVKLNFQMDELALTVATCFAFIAWLTARFAANYLHREAGFQRFYLILGVFISGIQLVVLAGNALFAFVGWEMCGIASFLLIAYAWERPTATANALFAFVTNRIGDAGWLFALGLAIVWVGSLDWSDLLQSGRLPVVEARMLALGLVLAALVKSGQLPFSPWVARALEGPTPSSAVFYGAILIHAGVFLLLRLDPLLAQVPDLRAGLILVGQATAAYALVVSWVQSDIKSALIYATLFQVGIMVAEIGAGWVRWASWHLCLHAAWRFVHFLLSPSWLRISQGRPPSPPAWLARWQRFYTAALQAFWLDRLALILLLQPTLGFAKDARRLERDFIDPSLGQVGQGRPVAADRPLVTADGWPGRLLAALSQQLQRLENRLLLRGRGGTAEQAMRHLGAYLRTLENLFEQPRYLMMAVMATFVVIL